MPNAFAHITLAQNTAAPGSTYTATLRVPHGCSGSATTGITVFLPASVSNIAAEPKEGWSLSKKADDADKQGERVAQVSWSGGKLLNSDYAEFSIRMKLPATPGRILFRVLQQCEQGQSDWGGAPVDGQPASALPAPALDVTTTPAQPGEHVHSH
jgi:uncharacterized protein YcnI